MMKCKVEKAFNRRRTDSPSRIKYAVTTQQFACFSASLSINSRRLNNTIDGL